VDRYRTARKRKMKRLEEINFRKGKKKK
jgi:hypothetical protein